MIDRLKKVFLTVKPGTDVSSVDEKTNLKLDLGLDSMSLLMLAFNVEEEFGVQFGDEEVKLETVGDVCDFIRRKSG